MSLFGSLYTGTAGMLAQERATAVTSENIANITTTGYKRQDTAFHELVTSGTGRYSSDQNGSVSSARLNRVTQQGAVQQTNSTTDLAIIGSGFFAVRAPGAAADEGFLYTRNGTFQPDSNGILRNSAGYELYGWPTDQNGLATSGPSTSSLQLVNVDLFQTQTTPTSFGELSINLSATEAPIDPHTLVPAQLLPVSAQAADFSRSLTVYDEAGTARLVNFEFRHTIGPMAHFTSGSGEIFNATDVLVDPLGPTPGILAGDVLQVTDGTNTLDVTFADPADISLNQANTMKDVIDVINNFTDGGGANPYTARLENGRLLVQANDPTATLDITGSSASVLGGTGLAIIPDPADADYAYAPEADITADGLANPNQSAFPPIADTTTPNPFNWWEVRITTVDPANPTSGTNVEVLKGLINFNGDGTFNVTEDANGQALVDLGTLTFDNADPTSTVTMNVDMADFSQFSGGYNVIAAEQNGAPLGSLVGVEITREGVVESVFSNGERVPAFQIPLAHFTNANGLERISGTAFRETANSGEVTLFDAGLGGTGLLQASSLEGSNVDLADEFSNLIVTQRAFGLNSRLINTIDEMTQQLAQLKR